jgi:DNA mismatch repair protein MSH4
MNPDWGTEPMPDVFINIKNTPRKVQCQTLDLIKLSERQEDAAHEAITRSDQIV